MGISIQLAWAGEGNIILPCGSKGSRSAVDIEAKRARRDGAMLGVRALNFCTFIQRHVDLRAIGATPPPELMYVALSHWGAFLRQHAPLQTCTCTIQACIAYMLIGYRCACCVRTYAHACLFFFSVWVSFLPSLSALSLSPSFSTSLSLSLSLAVALSVPLSLSLPSSPALPRTICTVDIGINQMGEQRPNHNQIKVYMHKHLRINAHSHIHKQ